MKFLVELSSSYEAELNYIVPPGIIEANSLEDAVKKVGLEQAEFIEGDGSTTCMYKLPGLNHSCEYVSISRTYEISSHEELLQSIWSSTGDNEWLESQKKQIS